MPFLIFLLAVVIGALILAVNAAILGVAVPALVADPGNFFGWLGVLVVLGSLGAAKVNLK